MSASGAIFLVSGLTVASHSYAPNHLNQHGTVGSTAYTYHSRGNLTLKRLWTYACNTKNLLLSATTSGTSDTYDYERQILRRSKTINGTTTAYLNVPTALAVAAKPLAQGGQSINPVPMGLQCRQSGDRRV